MWQEVRARMCGGGGGRRAGGRVRMVRMVRMVCMCVCVCVVVVVVVVVVGRHASNGRQHATSPPADREPLGHVAAAQPLAAAAAPRTAPRGAVAARTDLKVPEGEAVLGRVLDPAVLVRPVQHTRHHLAVCVRRRPDEERALVRAEHLLRLQPVEFAVEKTLHVRERVRDPAPPTAAQARALVSARDGAVRTGTPADTTEARVVGRVRCHSRLCAEA